MNTVPMHRLWATGLVLFATTLTPLFAQAESTAAATKRVRPSAAARIALSAAAQVLAKAKGTKGKERSAHLQTAATAYEKVAADFAADRAGAAAASFAAGGIWRSAGELQRAGTCFSKAQQLDTANYGTRATMELAHLARRNKDAAKASTLYAEVVKTGAGSSRGLQAQLWIARLLADGDQPKKATAAFRQAVAAAATPRQQIDACNRLANHLIKAADLDSAAKVITQAEQAAKRKPEGKPKAVERALRGQAKAYEKMSARRALQRARDKVNKAHLDAQRLEKSRDAGK